MYTTLHVQRRGTYELAHFGKGVVIGINRNSHLLVPHTRAVNEDQKHYDARETIRKPKPKRLKQKRYLDRSVYTAVL